MKKIISLVLALLIACSCFSVVSYAGTTGELIGDKLSNILYNDATISAAASALTAFKVNNLPESYDCEIRDLPEWDQVNLLGLDLDFLYNNDGYFAWSFMDVYVTDENGNKVLDANGKPTYKITIDDISTAIANINTYLQRILYDKYGGIDFYTVENAIALSNFVGKILRSDFKTLEVSNFKSMFNNQTPTTNEFFLKVSTLSGLGEIINYNWVGKGSNHYRPVVDALGGDYIDMFSDYYTEGVKLGSKILEGAHRKIVTVGPIQYILDFLNLYTSAYTNTYRNPTLDLLALKTSALKNVISQEELKTVNGLLKVIFCNCDSASRTGCFSHDKSNINHFQPVEFPVERFASAADTDEQIVYLFYYLNLCGAYADNNAYINALKVKIDGMEDVSDTDKTRINSILDGFFLNDFESTINNAIVSLYKENIAEAPDNLFIRFRNTMMNFLKKIADYFDYLRKIITGELQYGQGNSPFN